MLDLGNFLTLHPIKTILAGKLLERLCISGQETVMDEPIGLIKALIVPPLHRRGRGRESPARSYDSSQGVQAKTRMRPANNSRNNENIDKAAAVPAFGVWNLDPSSANGYTDVFNKVREEEHNPPRKDVEMPSPRPYTNTNGNNIPVPKKVVSGDDDLPDRDNIGERRRKYELQGLARPTNKFDDNAMEEDDEVGVSEDEFYRHIKEQRAAKLAAKAEIYSRSSAVPSIIETVDGKRNITYQMEKNRGLTRARKKLIKNPRKKYKLKYKDAENRRKGQVREIKKPMHLYGGEASGINTGISRSVRFKN